MVGKGANPAPPRVSLGISSGVSLEAASGAAPGSMSVDVPIALPWTAPLLREILNTRRGHALLLHGPGGVGQFELGLAVAQGWLCEGGDDAPRPCDACPSCHLVRAHAHPDLMVVLPEVLQERLGWAAPDGTDAASDRASKAKPSKEIKVQAVRAVVNFAQTTSARGRGKVVVLFPAEQMNGVSANTLLKTLEEPPGDARFVLGSAQADTLLPTIRSRCQAVAMKVPPTAEAIDWLAARQVKEPAILLAATGGQPQEALEWSLDGIDAELWKRLPDLVAQGVSTPFAAWPLSRLVGALQKLCHDAACKANGAAPRYFAAATLGPEAEHAALMGWMHELQRVARHVEHPWNAGLLAESLIQQGQRALRPMKLQAAASAFPGSAGRGGSLHSFR